MNKNTPAARPDNSNASQRGSAAAGRGSVGLRRRGAGIKLVRRPGYGHAACVALAALLVCPTVQAGEAGSRKSVRIWPTAVVSDDDVLLRDVAEFSGFDPGSLESLARAAVFGAPNVGGESIVRVDDVRGALAESGVNLAEVHIFGASRCRVTRMRPLRNARASVSPKIPERDPSPRQREHAPKRPLKPSARLVSSAAGDGVFADQASARESNQDAMSGTLEAALRRHIEAQFTQADGRIEIRFSPTSLKALAEDVGDSTIRIRNQDDRRTGLVAFEVTITSANGASRDVLVSAEVATVRSVVVARRPINQGQIISGRDLRLEERRFERNESLALDDLAAAVGQQCKRFIREGEMVDVKSIESRPLIRRGDLVKIVMSGGGVEIRTSGQAQAAGALGDVIAVRRDGSRRKQELIDATVVGPGLVTYTGARMVASTGE